MALTTERTGIDELVAELGRTLTPEGQAELSRRVDALVEAVELLSLDHYEHPALSESRLRAALARARRA